MLKKKLFLTLRSCGLNFNLTHQILTCVYIRMQYEGLNCEFYKFLSNEYGQTSSIIFNSMFSAYKMQFVYLLAGQASARWKVGDVLCGDAPQDRHQVRDSGLPTVPQ